MVPYSLNPDLTKLDTLEKRNPALSECALAVHREKSCHELINFPTRQNPKIYALQTLFKTK